MIIQVENYNGKLDIEIEDNIPIYHKNSIPFFERNFKKKIEKIKEEYNYDPEKTDAFLKKEETDIPVYIKEEKEEIKVSKPYVPKLSHKADDINFEDKINKIVLDPDLYYLLYFYTNHSLKKEHYNKLKRLFDSFLTDYRIHIKPVKHDKDIHTICNITADGLKFVKKNLFISECWNHKNKTYFAFNYFSEQIKLTLEDFDCMEVFPIYESSLKTLYKVK